MLDASSIDSSLPGPIIFLHMNLKRLALLLPLMALGAAPRAAFRLEEALSERALLFAETPSAPAFRAAFSKTPLAKFFDDVEVRAFAGDAFTSPSTVTLEPADRCLISLS